jgi:hypothetical protein
MLGKAARILCGTDERADVIRKRKHEIDLARAGAQQVAAPSSPALVPVVAAKRVKLATVAEQANDLEVPELSREAASIAYANYEKLSGGPPARDVELTSDQLTSLHYSCKEKAHRMWTSRCGGLSATKKPATSSGRRAS